MGMTGSGIHELVERDFSKQLAETRRIIGIKSVLNERECSEKHPFGPDMSCVLSHFLGTAAQMGFKTKNLDNYVGYVEIGDEGLPLIGILAHLDVMPEGKLEEWMFSPYAAEISDGVLYGRGSVDDKGPAMAVLFAMAALRDSQTALRRRFRLIVGLDEESGSRCIKYYREHAELPEFSFSPDASFPVVNAEKGILRIIVTVASQKVPADALNRVISINGGDRFNVVPDRAEIKFLKDGQMCVITAQGRSAHAMEPYKGLNAVQNLICAIQENVFQEEDMCVLNKAFALAGTGCYGESLSIKCRDDVSGDLTCNCAAVESNISDGLLSLSLKFDIRYPVTIDPDGLIANIKKHTEEMGAKLSLHTHKAPLYVREDHPAVQTLLDAYEEITNTRPAPISMGGGTYCRFMPNAVSAGPLFPGEEETAHQPNENISLDDLKKCTHIYAEALLRFNGM